MRDEQVPCMQSPLSPSDSHGGSMTRRQLLRMMAASSVALVGGAALAACGGGGGSTGNITLLTTGWPVGAMPSKADIAKDPVNKAYADTLQNWMKKNPGVTIKSVSTNVWDTPTLTTAVSSGTAPTWYPGNVLGSWNDLNVLSAFSRGLAADVTELCTKYNIEGLLADYCKPAWQHWKSGGKYFGAPIGFNAGTGVYYRADLIAQAGLEPPKPGWTWEDLRKYAKALTKGKVHGAALQPWAGIGTITGANEFGLRTTIPAPRTGWHWSYDYLSDLDEWTRLVNIYRGMYFEDKSLLSQANWTDGDPTAAFIRGDAAMMVNTCVFFTQAPESAEGVVQLATRFKKPIWEVVGFVAQPVGLNGAFGNSQAQMDIVSFDPHLMRNQTALTKAFDLYEYFTFGQGVIDQKVATYNATKDIQRVYDSVTPLTSKLSQITGVPGTARDAWGKQYVDQVLEDASIPLVPKSSWFLPPERSAGMTTAAYTDAQNALAYSQKDVKEILSHLQTVQNQQAASLSSSIPQADFIKAAQGYYSAHNDFWQKYAPNFSTNVYKPFYERKIVPAIGG